MRESRRAALSAAIHDILIRDWDPIGLGDEQDVQDEYDSYIPGILRLLTAGADRVKIAAHLTQIARVSMGLSPDPDDGAQAVADRIIETYRLKREYEPEG